MFYQKYKVVAVSIRNFSPGTEVKFGTDEKYVIVRQNDILAIIE